MQTTPAQIEESVFDFDTLPSSKGCGKSQHHKVSLDDDGDLSGLKLGWHERGKHDKSDHKSQSLSDQLSNFDWDAFDLDGVSAQHVHIHIHTHGDHWSV